MAEAAAVRTLSRAEPAWGRESRSRFPWGLPLGGEAGPYQLLMDDWFAIPSAWMTRSRICLGSLMRLPAHLRAHALKRKGKQVWALIRSQESAFWGRGGGEWYPRLVKRGGGTGAGVMVGKRQQLAL